MAEFLLHHPSRNQMHVFFDIISITIYPIIKLVYNLMGLNFQSHVHSMAIFYIHMRWNAQINTIIIRTISFYRTSLYIFVSIYNTDCYMLRFQFI